MRVFAFLTITLLSFGASAQVAFLPGPNDATPAQPRGERQTRVKKIRCEGAEYAVMYEQGGFMYTAPQVTGVCAWDKTETLEKCRADKDTPKTAKCWDLAQKFYGIEIAYPKMICSNTSFEFTFRIKGKQIEMTASEFAGISEATGFIFEPIAKAPVKIKATGSSVCPFRLTEETASELDLKLCFKGNIGSTATFAMAHGGKRVEAQNTQLNCITGPNFNRAVAPLIEHDANPEVDDIGGVQNNVIN